MNRIKKTWPIALFITLALAGIAGLTLAQRGRVGHVRILKLAHGLDMEHPVHKAMVFMAGQVKEKSGGELLLEVFPNGQLGSERENIEQIQIGCMDLTKVSTAALESFVPEMGVFGVPYIFRDAGHFWRVLEGPIGERFLRASEPKGLRGLCYYDSGSRNFYTMKKPIRTPADLAGMKIRVVQSKTSMDMIRALGASPTPIPWGELYTALQQGVVDGAENNLPSFWTARHYEVAKYFVLDEHTRIPDVVLISAVVWNTLSPEEQRILQAAADASVTFQRDLWDKVTQESLDKSVAEGVTIEKVDKALFVEQVKTMREGYQDSPIGKTLDEIAATP